MVQQLLENPSSLDGDEHDDINITIQAAHSIVSHYSQAVHLVTDTEEDGPYFDSLLGRPFHCPAIIKHWVEKCPLMANDNFFAAGLISTYLTTVRKSCFSDSKKSLIIEPSAHVVLIHYEMFVCATLKRYDIQTISIQDEVHEVNDRNRKGFLRIIRKSMYSIMADIFTLTAKGAVKNNTRGETKLKNHILPTLLRILTHFISIIHQYIGSDDNPDIRKEIKDFITISTMVALTFSPDCSEPFSGSSNMISCNLDLFELLPPRYQEHLTFGDQFNECCYPLNQTEDDNKDDNIEKSTVSPYLQTLMDRVCLSSNEHDLFSSSLMMDLKGSKNTSLHLHWMDHVNGTGFRSGRELLHQLTRYAAFINKRDRNLCDESCNTKCTSIRTILSLVGTETFIITCRKHFYGRLDCLEGIYNDEIQPLVNEGTSYNGIMNVEKNVKEDIVPKYGNDDKVDAAIKSTIPSKNFGHRVVSFSDDLPFNKMPSRIPPALRLLRSLCFPHVTSSVWELALPILLSLIDSIKPADQALAGSTLLHLLDECTPTSFIHSGPSFFETSTRVLTTVCQSCNDPIVMLIMCEVRSRIFKIVGPVFDVNQSGILRRRATASLLSLVKSTSYCGPNGDEESVARIGSVLLGGIHPLMKQHAALLNADSLELGRLGLSTLLPLIRWDSQTLLGRRVQIGAISCLISLMMGCYPILPRHGGKIMSELISCIGRGLTDLKADIGQDAIDMEVLCSKHVIIFAAHAASVALVLCEERADNVLKIVEEGLYPEILQEWCQTVRLGSKVILKQQQHTHQ